MRMHNPRRWPRVPTILAFVGMLLGGVSETLEAALTTKSPEVLKAIDRGIEYLTAKGTSDNRLGAYALAGMSLLTYGESIDHPTVAECAAKIQEALGDRDVEELSKSSKFDMYSTGMSIIFLVDRAPDKHRADIECLLAYLLEMQKPHGGWGYPGLKTGDTSMTQYGVLSSWTAIDAGFNVPIGSIEKVTLWLVRTQDPSGGYGYQGQIGENNKLVKQSQVKQSLTAAGLGSLYICSDMLGMTKKVERRDDDVPRALREVKPKENKLGSSKVKTSIDSQLVHATEGRGNQWFAKNFKVDAGQYNHYYLYAFERYMSSREHCEKIKDKDPEWYSDIAAHLLEEQAEDGSWTGDCKVVPDTSFAVLFLLRSMKKKWGKAKNFGEGIMVGGRGLPKNTGKAMLNAEGKVVSRPLLGPAERLLAALKNAELANIDDSINLVEELPADKLDVLMAKHGDVMRRLVGNKSPKARWAIVKALGKTRNLDNVEVLIYALTDPIPEVARAANESLSRIRRNLDAVVLPEKFSEEDRRLVIEKWKAWYRSIRPDAKFEWTESK